MMSLENFLQSFESIKDGSVLAFGIAIVAGIVSSAVCPCTLPVGVGMAGFVGSTEVQAEKKRISHRFRILFRNRS